MESMLDTSPPEVTPEAGDSLQQAPPMPPMRPAMRPIRPKSKHKQKSRYVRPGKCDHCKTEKTPLWRKWENLTLCNACGLYMRVHHQKRNPEAILALLPGGKTRPAKGEETKRESEEGTATTHSNSDVSASHEASAPAPAQSSSAPQQRSSSSSSSSSSSQLSRRDASLASELILPRQLRDRSLLRPVVAPQSHHRSSTTSSPASTATRTNYTAATTAFDALFESSDVCAVCHDLNLPARMASQPLPSTADRSPWVQCADCDLWFHKLCVSTELAALSEYEITHYPFGCRDHDKRRGRRAAAAAAAAAAANATTSATTTTATAAGATATVSASAAVPAAVATAAATTTTPVTHAMTRGTALGTSGGAMTAVDGSLAGAQPMAVWQVKEELETLCAAAAVAGDGSTMAASSSSSLGGTFVDEHDVDQVRCVTPLDLMLGGAGLAGVAGQGYSGGAGGGNGQRTGLNSGRSSIGSTLGSQSTRSTPVEAPLTSLLLADTPSASTLMDTTDTDDFLRDVDASLSPYLPEDKSKLSILAASLKAMVDLV